MCKLNKCRCVYVYIYLFIYLVIVAATQHTDPYCPGGADNKPIYFIKSYKVGPYDYVYVYVYSIWISQTTNPHKNTT